MNLEDILQLQVFEDAVLAAGVNGKKREVQHINMMDAPDIVDFLKKDELLVTTAYHFKDDTSLLLNVIERMAEQRCSGLGIKTKRFLSRIPEEAIDLADKVSLPLIELPADLRLGTIVNQTLRSILNMRTNELKNALEAHRVFTHHIMSGKGLKTLLQRVASMVEYQCLLLDQHSNLICSSHPNIDILMEMEVLHKSSYKLFLPKTSYTCFTLTREENPQVVTVFPIYTHQVTCGTLVVVGDVPISNSGVILTVEQAANVIAFELMKENALKQYARRARNDFFINVVEGSFSSNEEVINRAKEFDLQKNQKYIGAAGKLDEEEVSLSFARHQMEADRVYEFLEGELEVFPFPVHFFIKGNMCFILLEIEDVSGDMYDGIEEALEDMQASVWNQFQRTISFGISNISRQFLEVKEAYTEAVNALQSGYLAGSTSFIQAYQTKDISELFRIIPSDDLQKFCSYTLQALSDASYSDQSLLHTLSIYLETHCHISETAKRLYVHRNTVIYRLEKIEELLGQNLKDPDTTLRLRLALRIQSSFQLS
ncbi:PucR family transcriptional regulator [Salibacterium aidingense]|uniref:PucR family transcriptional regulator n=1 Tax=Salibacterium aidingense TaxID=384933 RepID=UPI003BE8171A